MFKARKIGVAITMGLMLSLTLLASGAFAQDTTITQSSTSAVTHSAALTGNNQQGTQQVLPTSKLKTNQAHQPPPCRYKCIWLPCCKRWYHGRCITRGHCLRCQRICPRCQWVRCCKLWRYGRCVTWGYCQRCYWPQ